MSSVPSLAQLEASGRSLPPRQMIQRRFEEAGQPGVDDLLREHLLQTIKAKYQHLPPLMAPLPAPSYASIGETHFKALYRKDELGTSLYRACATGHLQEVEELVTSPLIGYYELEFGLEEAFHNFQSDVIGFLLAQTEVKLHYRCFRRGDGRLEKQQNVFTSASPKLQSLLQLALQFGWHPNQLLGPPILDKGRPLRQDVALHYPRCILDTDILRLLLTAGADPTIARNARRYPGLDVGRTPVQRLTGDILEMAVNIASAESVELLFDHGATARPEYGMPLHSLVRREPDHSTVVGMNDALSKELWTQGPEVEFPTLETRISMAELLIKHGADVNAEADVFRHVGRYTVISCISHSTTPILHAKHSADWDMVKLLLRAGADPEPRSTDILPPNISPEMKVRVRQQQWLRNYQIYRIGVPPMEVERKFDELVQQQRRL